MYKKNFALFHKDLLGDGKHAEDNGKGKETLFIGIPSRSPCGGERENLTRPVIKSLKVQGGRVLGDVEVSN